MILSDRHLKKAIKNKKIIIDPPPIEKQYSPSALDLRIGEELVMWDPGIVSQKGVEVILIFGEVKIPELKKYSKEVCKENDGSYIIKPNCLYQALTYEYVEFPKECALAARVEGRSSLARLGVVVHLTAPTIHCGFKGKIALEIINFGPFKIRIYPYKTSICQLIIEKVSSVPSINLESDFIKQTTPIGSS